MEWTKDACVLVFVSIKLAAIRWSKKAGFQFPSAFFPLIFSTIEAMPVPLSSANILQEPSKEAGCAIAAPDRSLRSAGATRADAGSVQENKENFSCCETRDLEKQRLSLHRIAIQGDHASGSRVGDVNHVLSRGEDKIKTVQSTLSQKTDPIVNPPLLTSLDSKENKEMESILYSVQCKEDPSFPPRCRAVRLLPDHRYLDGSIVMLRSCAQRRPVNGLHLYSL